MRNSTFSVSLSSVTDAVMVTNPITLEFAVGLEIFTWGGVSSFNTVIDALIKFLAISNAVTVMVCSPSSSLSVSQSNLYGDSVTVALRSPLIVNSTFSTPIASVAIALIVTVPETSALS